MEDIEKFTCPACGANSFQKIENKEIIQAPFGKEFPLDVIELICNSCESKIDFTKIFTENEKLAYEESEKSSIELIFNYFEELGISLASIERALDLPQRTLSRWRSKNELSSIGIILLRILRTFPWILEVAQNKFDSTVAKKIAIENAVQDLFKLTNSLDIIDMNKLSIPKYPKNIYVSVNFFGESESGENLPCEIIPNFPQVKTTASQFVEVKH